MSRWLVGGAALLVLAGCGGGHAASAAPKVFTIHGTVASVNGSLGQTPRQACVDASWAVGLDRGTQVVVSDPKGNKVALGHLGPGVGNQLGCRWAFTVAGVPDRFGLYSIVVGDKPAETFSRAKLGKPVSFLFT